MKFENLEKEHGLIPVRSRRGIFDKTMQAAVNTFWMAGPGAIERATKHVAGRIRKKPKQE